MNLFFYAQLNALFQSVELVSDTILQGSTEIIANVLKISENIGQNPTEELNC